MTLSTVYKFETKNVVKTHSHLLWLRAEFDKDSVSKLKKISKMSSWTRWSKSNSKAEAETSGVQLGSSKPFLLSLWNDRKTYKWTPKSFRNVAGWLHKLQERTTVPRGAAKQLGKLNPLHKYGFYSKRDNRKRQKVTDSQASAPPQIR